MPSPRPRSAGASEDGSARARILDAAFEVLHARGYGATQTREIAARARVSKRDIYREFGSKDGIFAALITSRAELMRRPTLEPNVSSIEGFATTLQQVGAALMQQLYDPGVLAMFRLAIASAEGSQLARILERNGIEPTRRALAEMMAAAVDAGILSGDGPVLAVRFVGLLTGGAHVSILLGIVRPPRSRERARHAADVTAAFLRLYGR